MDWGTSGLVTAAGAVLTGADPDFALICTN